MPDLEHCYITIQGYQVRIDQEDLERVSQFKWRVTVGAKGRQRVVTSKRGPQGVRSQTLGKILMNPPNGKQVYPRRYRDELNYCKSNLIVCTIKERQMLLPKHLTETSSIYKGVSKVKNTTLWRTQIEVDGHSINLGNFESEESAALKYNRAASQYFGEFCYQNRMGRKKIRSTA